MIRILRMFPHAAAVATLLSVAAAGRAANRDIPGTYATITDAVNAASPGDTIRFLSAGTYPSTATPISKNLAFIGPTNGRVVITAPTGGGRVFQINTGVTVSFDHLTMSGGALTGTDRGAGILNGGNTTISACTLSGNTSAASGAAIYNSGGATLSMTNCTVSGNTVSGGGTAGGGAISNGGSVTLLNCTVAYNTSSGVAGGLDNRNNTSFTLQNTLVANNTGGSNPDMAGAFTSQDYNLVGDGTGATFSGATGHNQVGTAASPVNARIGPLQDNGGATYTVALLPNSPAIDAIPGTAPANFPTTDQRDAPRPQDGGDGDNIPEGDIGAYEASAPVQFYVATTGSDGNTGVTPDQPLRNIVTAINRSGISGVINIAPGTYTENIVLQKSVTLQGSLGAAAGTVIQSPPAASKDTTFVVFPDTTLVMSDLTIANGFAQNTGFGSGGGLFNEGTVTLERCIVTGNGAAYGGGGIVNYTEATMTLQDTTVSGNEADEAAGVENDGTLTMVNSTVSGNNAGAGAGGGIGNTGTLTMTNCTVANNTAAQGGGLYVSLGKVRLLNVTISGNTANDGGGIANLSHETPDQSEGLRGSNTVVAGNTATTGPDISGEWVTDLGFNFIGNNKDGTIFPAVNDIIGTPGSPKNPQLGALADNGGYTQTMSPSAGSPLIDAGPGGSPGPGTFPATDQRGAIRPIGAKSDIGAVEYQPKFTVTNTNDDANPGSLRWAINQANATGNAIIAFAIAPTGAAGGVKTITLAAANGGLPVLSQTTFVDGWSQGGAGYHGTPLIEINGQNVPTTFGLNIQASNCVVRGLCINRFPNAGSGNAFGIGVFTGTGTWIYGCMLGTDPTGTIARGNGQGGIWAGSDGTLIGTNGDGVNDAAEANVISANAFDGIFVTSNNNTIAGNFIGTDATGENDLRNGTVAAAGGVRVQSGTGNRITKNTIAFNNGLGIDLGGDGVTPNDPGDDDGGPNTLQNYPVITGASTVGATTTIAGTLNSTPGTTFTVELFRSDAKDPSGFGQGQHYIASTPVATDLNGNGSFTVAVPALAGGQWITATATNPTGNTSEFSQAVVIQGPPSIAAETPTFISTASAMLNAVVNPGGLSTSVQFQVKSGGSYVNVGAPQAIGSGGPLTASYGAPHAGLPGTAVTYRAVATNSAGTTTGPDSVFTLLDPSAGTALDTTGGTVVNASIPSALTNNYTISAWVYLRAGGVLCDPRVSILSGAACTDSIELLVRSNTCSASDPQFLELGRFNAFNGPTDTVPIPLNQWVNVAVTVSSTNQIAFYVNGQPAGTADGTGKDLTLAKSFQLAPTACRFFNGRLDEVRIWNTALTAAQVAANWNRRLAGNEANLVGYWRFDDAVGTTVADSSPSGNNATIAGDLTKVSWVGSTAFDDRTPVSGSALQFSGTSSYVQLAPGVYFSGDFTIEGWVYPRSFGSWARLLDFGNGPGNDNVILALSSGTTGKPAFSIYSGATGANVVAPNPLPLNRWSHLAFVQSGGTGTLYVNGVPVVSGSTGLPRNVVRTNNYIGRSNWSADANADATFDEVRLWNVARTQAQIQSTLYRTAAGQAGLIAELSLDEDAGGAVNDANGGNVLGYLSGPVWVPSTAPIGPPYATLDVTRALKIAAGLLAETNGDARLNVEAGNAVIDLSDAARIARRAAGLDANP